MCYTHGYACARIAKSQRVIINAVKHSLFAHQRQRGRWNGPPSRPALLEIRVGTVYVFLLLKGARSIFPIS